MAREERPGMLWREPSAVMAWSFLARMGPSTAPELAAALAWPRPEVERTMARLRFEGFARCARDGRWAAAGDMRQGARPC